MLTRPRHTPATVRASGLFVDTRDRCFDVLSTCAAKRRVAPTTRAVGRWVTPIALGFAWLMVPCAVWADEKPTLSGTWTASALSESWSVSEWGEACGPKPAPKGAGGGSVQIREQGGELSMVGAGRAFSTAECWEQMPGMSRTSHTQSGGGRFWRTRCSTAASDPRRAFVVTSIQATDNTISLTETGEYQFIIHDTTCKASVSRSRSYSLVRRDGEQAPMASASASASAAPLPPPPKATAEAPRQPARCTDAAGEPARLEVHPARKLLRAGERFGFRARVLDAEGCPTGAKPSWSIAPGPLASKLRVDATGGVTVEDDAPEGAAELVASAFGKSVRITLEVAREENYEALLAARGLNDAGAEDEVAVAVIATGTIGGRTVAARDAARERKTTFIAIVVAVAALLGFAGLVLARRGTRKETELEAGDEADESVEQAGTLDAESEDSPSEAQNGSGRAAGPPAKPRVRASRGKICPTCGERYDGEATFCGKDATKLVLLN